MSSSNDSSIQSKYIDKFLIELVNYIEEYNIEEEDNIDEDDLRYILNSQHYERIKKLKEEHKDNYSKMKKKEKGEDIKNQNIINYLKKYDKDKDKNIANLTVRIQYKKYNEPYRFFLFEYDKTKPSLNIYEIRENNINNKLIYSRDYSSEDSREGPSKDFRYLNFSSIDYYYYYNQYENEDKEKDLSIDFIFLTYDDKKKYKIFEYKKIEEIAGIEQSYLYVKKIHIIAQLRNKIIYDTFIDDYERDDRLKMLGDVLNNECLYIFQEFLTKKK